MYSNPMNTLADAYEVIRRYGLEYDFLVDGGSAEGFAAWMYINGRPLADVSVLALELKNYKADHADHASRGEDLDEVLRGDAADLTRIIEQHMKERLALAECIRSVKFSEGGGHVWDFISNLATNADYVAQQAGGDISFYADRVVQVVDALRQHKFGFDQAEGNHYHPGADRELDALVLVDLLELDQSLFKAPTWAGREPLMSLELTALFNFVKNFKQADLESAAMH